MHSEQNAVREWVEKNWSGWGMNNYDEKRAIKKRELAIILDKAVNPFSLVPIDHFGNYISP